ncbi:hypothetical protein ACFYXS_18430 [Streptomyces sp. NPDC002574]|uniref:hypothetical protein n=1 Tax=Streptomyces sp. NPDC002574 TaxID=3364652 RepID=UPI00367CC183
MPYVPMVAEVVLLYALPALAGAAALLLARSALRHWWEQRAGRVYELPVAYGGAALRAGGAVLALGAAFLTAAFPPLAGLAPDGARDVVVAAAPAPPAPEDVRPGQPPEPEEDDAPPRTLGHPSGGTLEELEDGTRVWLPPQYDFPNSAGLYFPLVVAHLDPADPDLFAGFAAQSLRGLADPVVVVLPARCGGGAVELPDAVGRLYRVLPGRTARAVLGVGQDAACVVRGQLGHPSRYAAAIGVSGAYEPDGPQDLESGPARSPSRPYGGDAYPDRAAARPQLLLAVPSGEESARSSALALRDRMRGVPAEVRVLDNITPRRRLFALVAGYVTEKLDGPGRP